MRIKPVYVTDENGKNVVYEERDGKIIPVETGEWIEDTNVKTVNILGTEYTVEDEESLVRSNSDGIHEAYVNRIALRPLADMALDSDDEQVKLQRYKEVKRHEAVHAMFFQSGLVDYCHDEQLVSWIAIQAPKMFKVFQEMDAL